MGRIKRVAVFFARMGNAFYRKHPFIVSLISSFFLEIFIESFAHHSLSEGLDFLFSSPVVFTLNMLIIALTLSVSVLFRRGIAMFITVFIVWIVAGTANGIVLLNRPSPFTISDFLILHSVFDIITVYLKVWQIIIIAVALLSAVIGLVIFWIKSPKRKRNFGLDIPNLGIIGAVLAIIIPVCLATGTVSANYSDLYQAYYDYGFPYSFSRGIFCQGISRPVGYDEETIDKVVDELKKCREAEGKSDGVEPNVIYVQLESFFDINNVNGVQFSENPLPNFTALKESYPSGFLTVPFIGSGTANTEFEVLTGMSIDYFSPGEYPYIMALRDSSCESAAYILKNRGYKTHTMHNNTGTFYSRHEVYPNLGFDTFIPIEYMYDVELNFLGWAKDKCLVSEIDKCLQSSEERDFVFTVSVQPHGAYTSSISDGKIKVFGIEDDEKRNMYSYYVNELYETDAFIGELISKYQDYDEPTVIVFYGDHLPDLKLTQEDLAVGNLYQTEYVVWSNYELPSTDAPDLQSYQLSSYVFDLIDVNEGIMFGIHKYFSGSEDYANIMKLMEFDALYGERYSYKGREYLSTEIRYGVSEIKITGASTDGVMLTVKGEGFNEYSVVYIDGKKKETELVDKNTLIVKKFRSLGKITVAQEADDGTVFSQTNAFEIK